MTEQQVSKERFELIKGSAELNHYLNGFQADDLIAFAVQQEQRAEKAEAVVTQVREYADALEKSGWEVVTTKVVSNALRIIVDAAASEGPECDRSHDGHHFAKRMRGRKVYNECFFCAATAPEGEKE